MVVRTAPESTRLGARSSQDSVKHVDHFLGKEIHRLRMLQGGSQASRFEQGTDPVYEQICSVESLEKAWAYILARDAKDGTLTKETQAAAKDPQALLETLSVALLEGTYMPNPLRKVSIPKKGSAGERVLSIPTVVDRVVERSVLEAISHSADLIQSSCSYAYRLGLGIDDAIHAVVMMREYGLTHVVRTDIKDFFPNVSLAHALEALPQELRTPRLNGLLRLIASPRRVKGVRRVRSKGVAQGSSLSPLLANISLNTFDRMICEAGFGYARFADDIVLCAANEAEAANAAEMVRRVAESHGHQLNKEKTVLTTFDEGFCFLGADFSRTRPDLDPHHDIKGTPNPNSVVYVGQEGARIHVSKGRLIIDDTDGLPQVSIPLKAVNRMVLNGNIGLSAGARSWALYNDIDVVFLSRRGSYLGQLAGPRSTANARRLLTQAAFAEDPERRLPLAREIIRAKMRNRVHVLQRTGWRDSNRTVKATCRDMRAIMEDINHAATIDEIMGLEGAASTSYFATMSALVPEDVAFDGRSRRPPRDLANAALSYGYAILLSECTGALLAAGLEPSLGVLHASTDKRPSLSLDLMEEFRPLLVDRTVLALLRTRRLRPEHAAPAESRDGQPGGVWLNRDGRKALVDGYEATLQRHVKGALPGFNGTWRRHIHHEAQLLGRAIMEDGYQWTGVSWR